MKLSVNILCPTCVKCDNLKKTVERALMITGAEATIRHVTNFSEFSRYSVNVSQTPILVINDKVEFAGQVPPVDILCRRISEIREGGTVL